MNTSDLWNELSLIDKLTDAKTVDNMQDHGGLNIAIGIIRQYTTAPEMVGIVISAIEKATGDYYMDGGRDPIELRTVQAKAAIAAIIGTPSGVGSGASDALVSQMPDVVRPAAPDLMEDAHKGAESHGVEPSDSTIVDPAELGDDRNIQSSAKSTLPTENIIENHLKSSEISVVDEDAFDTAVTAFFKHIMDTKERTFTDVIIKVIEAYESKRPNKPVSVKAIADALEIWPGDVKNVLIEAGVKFHE